jgi:serine protease inhibitor
MVFEFRNCRSGPKFFLNPHTILKCDNNMKNMAIKTSLLSFIVLSLIFFSCNKTTDENLPVEPVPINLTADQVSLIQSENTFAFDIFKKILENSGESENVIISPLSISCALSMTLNGANGTTRDAMLEALRLNGLTPENINNSYKDLSEALLNVDKRVLIDIANSVWSERNFEVKTPFKNILTDYYNAESKAFDITDPLAYREINTWIEDKTNGLIKNMLDGISDNTVMLLVNAIYFKGKWKSQFDKSNTVNKPFYKNDGTSNEVPMMKQVSNYKVFSGEGFVLAEFPYGQGNFVIDVILPDGQNGISALTPLLNDESFNGLLSHMAERETDLTFPRFKYGYKQELKDILTEMGMGIAFSDDADFSDISDLSLLINKVLHQAFIETNEEGTEAAAATVVEVGTTSFPPSPIILNVDHSFIYFIRETSTNSILFMGRVADPLAN